MGVHGRLDQRLGARANPPRQAHDTEQQPTDHDDRLHDIRPDHGLHAAQKGVDDGDHSDDNDDHRNRPIQELVEQQAHEIQDHRRSAHDVEQEGQGGVHPSPGPDPLLEELVDGQQLHPPVVGHSISTGQPGHRKDRQRKDNGMPVGIVGLAGGGDVRDAAGVRAHDGQSGRPGGDGSPRHHEFLRRAALAGVVNAHPDDNHAVRGQDRYVDGVQFAVHAPPPYRKRPDFSSKTPSSSMCLRTMSRCGSRNRWNGSARKSLQTPSRDRAHLSPLMKLDGNRPTL